MCGGGGSQPQQQQQRTIAPPAAPAPKAPAKKPNQGRRRGASILTSARGLQDEAKTVKPNILGG